MNELSTILNSDNIAPFLEAFVDESIDAMTKISEVASKTSGARTVGQDVAMGQVNNWTDGSARISLARAQEKQSEAARELSQEPIIARVRTRFENGDEKTYYFARNFTLTVPGITLTSYNSGAPVGRLASLDIGDEFELPNGQWVVVIEKGTYKPVLSSARWDGIDNALYSESFDPLFIDSLRRTVEHRGLSGEDVTGDPFAMFDDQPILTQSPRRKYLSGLGLRDQTVMNKVQDEIFRLPIDRQLMLEGPPGTGKTTTLIKRLSQKRVENLDREEDYRVIASNPLGGDHRSSWIMFSPTELLEHYLREAFARDNVPASQQRIQTWANFRNDLATRVLGLLRSGKRTQGFLRDEKALHFSDEALRKQPELYSAFDQMQFELFSAELDRALQTIVDGNVPDLRSIAQDMRRHLGNRGRPTLLSIHLAVDSNAPDLRKWVTETRSDLMESADRRIDQLGRVRGKEGIEALRRLIDKIDMEGPEDDDDETLEPDAAPSTTRDRMFRVLRASIRAMAIAARNGRPVAKTSKYKPVVDWIGDDFVPLEDLDKMGQGHALIAAVNMITLSTRNYFTRLPQRYRAFRKDAPLPWFTPEAKDASKLSPNELDLLVAIHLEAASDLLGSAQVRASLTQGNLQVLAPLLEEFRNQVLVDEATDFSPLQLRAMYCLSTPGVRSFFACGDFNQRLTRYGVSHRETLEWAVPKLEFRQVEIAYRQSAELRKFANRIIELSDGVLNQTSIEGPREAEGFAPVFHSSAEGSLGESDWISERIKEIESIYNDLPSIAVFVPNEKLVASVAEELRVALEGTNIDVMACANGQVLGQERHVRVFSVEHIKGLEFEAAFFHSLQDLATDEPDLVGKFLYVGATRAATFLGLSCSAELPDGLTEVVEGLGEMWPNP